MRTGRYDFREESFDVNEIVAALGIPIAAKDPTTGQDCKVLQPFGEDSLTEEWMKEQKWCVMLYRMTFIVNRTTVMLRGHDFLFLFNLYNLIFQDTLAKKKLGDTFEAGWSCTAIRFA